MVDCNPLESIYIVNSREKTRNRTPENIIYHSVPIIELLIAPMEPHLLEIDILSNFDLTLTVE